MVKKGILVDDILNNELRHLLSTNRNGGADAAVEISAIAGREIDVVVPELPPQRKGTKKYRRVKELTEDGFDVDAFTAKDLQILWRNIERTIYGLRETLAPAEKDILITKWIHTRIGDLSPDLWNELSYRYMWKNEQARKRCSDTMYEMAGTFRNSDIDFTLAAREKTINDLAEEMG